MQAKAGIVTLIVLVLSFIPQGVSLHLTHYQKALCPSDVGMLYCSSETGFVIWKCQYHDDERSVYCHNDECIILFNCGNLVLVPCKIGCEQSSNGHMNIQSSLEYRNVSTEPIHVMCTDGNKEEILVIAVKVPYTPMLSRSYSVYPAPEGNKRVVAIHWEEPPKAFNEHPLIYKLSVRPATTECGTCYKNDTRQNLTLTLHHRYTITVSATTCDGEIQSNTSSPLDIALTEPPEVDVCNATTDRSGKYFYMQWTLYQPDMKVKGESFKCLLRLHYKHKTTYGTANCSLNSINSYAGSAEDTIVNISITVINAIGKKESSRCSIDFGGNDTLVNSYVNPVPLGVVSAMAIVIITTAGLFLVCFKCRENDYCHLFSREAGTEEQKHGPRALAMNRRGEIIACYHKHTTELKIFHLSDLKKPWKKIVLKKQDKKKMEIENPRFMVIDEDEKFFLTDSYKHRLYKFSAEGTLEGDVGGCGDGFGKLHSPKGIVIVKDHVLVCDLYNRRVQSFNRRTMNPEFSFYMPEHNLCPIHISYNQEKNLLFISGTNVIYICEWPGDESSAPLNILKVKCWIKKYKRKENTCHLQRIGGMAAYDNALIITETIQGSGVVLNVFPLSIDFESGEGIPAEITRKGGQYQQDRSPDEWDWKELKVYGRAELESTIVPSDMNPHPVLVCDGSVYVSNDSGEESLKEYSNIYA